MLPYVKLLGVQKHEDQDNVECCTLLYHYITCETCTKILNIFISGLHSKRAWKISAVKILELMFLFRKLWKPFRWMCNSWELGMQ